MPLGPGKRNSRSMPRSSAFSLVPSTSGTAPQQEAALLLVEPGPHHTGVEVVAVHADGVGAEAAPVGEPFGLDDDGAEVDDSEDGRGGHRRPPVLATRYRSQLGMRSASTRSPEGRLTLSAAPQGTRVV